MFFIAQLTHTPELCFARPEHKEDYNKLLEFMEKAEEIARGLDSHYQQTIYQLRKKFSEKMQADPANAILALVEEIKDRLNRWQKPQPKFKKGYLALYARLAESADKGAIIRHQLD